LANFTYKLLKLEKSQIFKVRTNICN